MWNRRGPGDVSQGLEKGRKGRFPFNQKFRNFRNGDKFRKLSNFRKANHSIENSGNFGMKIKWSGNFQEKIFRKFRYTLGGCPLFLKSCKFAIVYSALVLLAAITGSWTSHAKMMDQYFTSESCHLSVNKY